jgi:hypothetical protein
MPTLKIGDKRIKIGDEFLTLPPDQQQATVDQIASQLGITAGESEQSKAARQDISASLPKGNVQGAGARSEFDALPTWAKPIAAADDLASLFGDAATFGMGAKGAAWLRSKIGGTDYESERAKIDKGLQNARARAGGAGLVAEIGGAVATPVQLAKAGITATRIPMGGKALGLTADGAAIGTADAYGHDRDVTTGAAIGAGFGLGGDLLTRAGGKILSPFMTSPERTAAANTLKKEGVDLTAGQATGSKKLRYAESELGGASAEALMEKQGEQFTRAALKRVGENADRATPEVIDKAFTRIGSQFDALSRNPLIPTPKIGQDLTQIAVDYAGTVAPSMRIPIIEKSINDALSVLQSGRMDGKVYKTLRSNLDRVARGTNQPEAKMAARNIINALDDAMEQSIAQLNPRELGKWREARKQYRNILVVEQAATGAGENAALGLISPSQLRNATVNKQGRRNYARGNGDFTDLARAGEAVLKPLPQSGTAPRLAARGLPNLLGAAVGAGGGAQQGGGWEGALLGAGAGFAVPYVAGRALMSGPMQSYLGNQAAGAITPEMRAMLSRALAGGGTAGLLGYQ